MKIIIIGAGVVGLSTALKAIEEGHDVTLIDKNNCPADETSAQNGAQLSYSHAISISNLASFLNLFKALFLKDQTLSIKLKEFLRSISWFVKIYLKKFFNKKSYLAAYYNFAKLSKDEFAYFKKLLPNLEINNSGSIHLFHKKSSFTKFQKIIKKQDVFKYDIVNQNAKKLKNISKKIYKAIYFSCDQSCDTKNFAKLTLEYLKNKKNFRFINNCEIENFIINNNIINAVVTSKKQEINADHFILASGMNSSKIFKKLNFNSPLVAVKGYSINLYDVNIDYSLIDHDKKMVYTNLGKKIRVAGLYDFHGLTKFISPIRGMVFNKVILKKFNKNSKKEKLWIGIRNATSDGFPAIGRSKKIKNLSYNIGHANLGWTLSAASAKIIIDGLNDEFNHNFEMIKASRFNI